MGGLSYITAGSDNNYSGIRSAFYAAGLMWVVYTAYLGAGPRPVTLYYSTSPVSSSPTWTGQIAITTTTADAGGTPYYNTWFDGTYFYYACANSTNTATMFRRGTPINDGTISWSQPEQTVALVAPGGVAVAPDSSGYPWVQRYQAASGLYKSSSNDGTWSTQAGFPTTNFGIFVTPLTATKMAQCVDFTGTAGLELWNGSAFVGGPSIPDNFPQNPTNCVAVGDTYYEFYTNQGIAGLWLNWFNGSAWQTHSIQVDPLVSGSGNACSMGYDPGKGNLFLIYTPITISPPAIVYKRYNIATASMDGAPTTLVTFAAGETFTRNIACWYNSAAGIIGVVYCVFVGGLISGQVHLDSSLRLKESRGEIR